MSKKKFLGTAEEVDPFSMQDQEMDVDRPATVKRRKLTSDNQYTAQYDLQEAERERKTPFVKLWLNCEMLPLMQTILQAAWPGLKDVRLPQLKLVNAFANFETEEQLRQALQKGEATVHDTKVVCKDNRNRPNQSHQVYLEGALYAVLRNALRKEFKVELLELGAVRRMDGCGLRVPAASVAELMTHTTVLGCATKVSRQQSLVDRKRAEATAANIKRIWKPKTKGKVGAPPKGGWGCSQRPAAPTPPPPSQSHGFRRLQKVRKKGGR
eukprot:GGOE01019445.1.p1 GENE.GGOE01019445.1~~GGOE01019445.1.p1  ORF type:complete len:281 (+),score=73.69 GGOE01019445.1:42-845(+)